MKVRTGDFGGDSRRCIRDKGTTISLRLPGPLLRLQDILPSTFFGSRRFSRSTRLDGPRNTILVIYLEITQFGTSTPPRKEHVDLSEWDWLCRWLKISTGRYSPNVPSLTQKTGTYTSSWGWICTLRVPTSPFPFRKGSGNLPNNFLVECFSL